jgi:hypothetical protein
LSFDVCGCSFLVNSSVGFLFFICLCLGSSEKLAIDVDDVPPYILCDGTIRYKGHLWVGAAPALRDQLLAALHSSPVSEHLGFSCDIAS